jgi:hypothetical protein
MFSNDVSPIGVDEKNHPRYMNLNDILTGLDGKEWIIIVRNNIRIWKRVITNEFMKPQEYVQEEPKETNETTNQMPPKKGPTDYNLFRRFRLAQLNSSGQNTGRTNINLVNSEWKELKTNSTLYQKTMTDIKASVNS